jgi:hypothetical protein
MATAADLIAEAEAATSTAQLDEIEVEAEGRVTVLQAIEDARARLGQQIDTQAEGEGVAHLAGDVTMPEVGAAAEWDTLEDFPTFTAGQWVSVDGAGVLEVVAVNQSAQGRLTLANHGTEGNQTPGTVVYGGTAITLTDTPPGEITATADPDFVWVGCSTCWTPRDRSRPVITYADWLADGFRYLVYHCMGPCNLDQHATLWGFWLEEAKPWAEGGPAALSTEVQIWGQS